MTTDIIERELTHSLSWRKWKELWEKAQTLVERAGLIHGVFSVIPDYEDGYSDEYQERILFLIRVAEDTRYHALWYGATKQLANVVFKHWWAKRGGLRDSERFSLPVRTELLRFLRKRTDIRATEYKYVEEIISDFTDRFCYAIWTGLWYQTPEELSQMLDLMSARGKLLTLLPARTVDNSWASWRTDADRAWSSFTPTVMMKLEQLARAESNAESTEEAAYRGSHAALVFVAARTALAEQERLSKKHALEREIANAQERLGKI